MARKTPTRGVARERVSSTPRAIVDLPECPSADVMKMLCATGSAYGARSPARRSERRCVPGHEKTLRAPGRAWLPLLRFRPGGVGLDTAARRAETSLTSADGTFESASARRAGSGTSQEPTRPGAGYDRRTGARSPCTTDARGSHEAGRDDGCGGSRVRDDRDSHVPGEMNAQRFERAIERHPRLDRQGDRRQARGRAQRRRHPPRRGPPAHRGRAGRRQDDARPRPRGIHRRDRAAHPVHARPAAGRRHRASASSTRSIASSSSRPARSSRTS